MLSAPTPPRGRSLSGSMSSMSMDSAGSDRIVEPLPSDESLSLPDEKPVATGQGINVGISLAEPLLFVEGFESSRNYDGNTAMLRGALYLRVTKPTKLKTVTLKFRGKATTKWPEGIPPKKIDIEETKDIMSHTWPFFNAQFPTAEKGPCADYVSLNAPINCVFREALSADYRNRQALKSANLTVTAREYNRRSLQLNTPTVSFDKGDSPLSATSVSQKGYRTFEPGTYVYNFELPLDSHLPETINVELGTVKYELEAVIERAGAFKANLVGSKEVTLIRTPSESSLEQVEPIAISRTWEDQLHYDIIISGKSFPLGAQIPIAFKMTPLAKVQCHRVKVFITENTEYFCKNKHVHRLEPTRKVQLFEKRADSASVSTYSGSSFRVASGGGVPYDQREAAARGEEIIPQNASSLLGTLDGELNAGPTELEMNVQLPSCGAEKDKLKQLHFDTTYANIQVHHWIKIVMRLSKLDPNDPTRRRHFEISIDSPINLLSCKATLANTSLPAYSSPHQTNDALRLYECGCPGAPLRTEARSPYLPATTGSGTTSSAASVFSNNTSNTVDTSNTSLSSGSQRRDSDQINPVTDLGLTRPQQAHTRGTYDSGDGPRPMHLLRAPSFNPPAFNADNPPPPPPLETPPPDYDSIASPTSGLADYFARLSDAHETEPDEQWESERGRTRIEIPLSPGSTRMNRSMDEPRAWLPVGRDAR